MAVFYNQKATLVTSDMVDLVVTTGMTTIIDGDVSGSYQYKGIFDLFGCGNPNSAVFIRLKDNIPWKKMTCFFEFNGTAACWAFNGGGNSTTNPDPEANYVEVTPETTDLVPGGNLEQYDENLGDRIFRQINAFSSNTNFVRKGSACDNNPSNFFHPAFTTGGASSIKSFWMTCRRKDKSNGLSGPFHCRSCNSTGSYIIIKNIFIF